MKISDFNFRKLYHQLCFVMRDHIVDNFMEITGFHGDAADDGILLYGYIDYEEGFTFEMLASARRSAIDDCDSYCRAKCIKFRRGSIKNCEMEILPRYLIVPFQEEITDIHNRYGSSAAIEAVRKDSRLDICRNPDYPDDVFVLLTAPGRKPEGCWVRCQGLQDSNIYGILLNSPYQDFAVDKGDIIDFTITIEDDKVVCIAAL